MNTQAQITGMIWVTFIVIMYVLLWAFFLGPVLSIWGERMVTMNSLTGLEALWYQYINLWLGFIPLVVYIIWAGWSQ